jgi:hypothetical protein
MNGSNTTPSLEVVCPIRNGGMHFAATLRSLRGQGGDGCSLLISDNFSSDGKPWRDTLVELAGWQVRVIQPPRELGRVEHWNWACEQSTGTIVKLIMSGDQINPDSLRALRETFASHPGISLAFGQNRIRETDKEFVAGAPHAGGEITHPEFIALSLQHFNFIGTLSAVAFRGDVLRTALPFHAEYAWTADWRLYSRCLKTAPAWCLPQPVCLLDRTFARLSSSRKIIGGSLREEWRYLAELAQEAPGSQLSHFLHRAKMVGFQCCVKYGRAVIPHPLRKILGACYRAIAPDRSAG